MYTAENLRSAKAILEQNIPGEYISSLELWTTAEFAAHLKTRFGLDMLIDLRDGWLENIQMFVWDPAEVIVYESKISDLETQLQLIKPFFSDVVYCYQLIRIDHKTHAFVRAGFSAELYFTLFESLFDLGNVLPDSFTFVEDAASSHWLVPEKFYPSRILTNFPFGQEQQTIVSPSWIRVLFALKLEEPPVDLYDLNLFGEMQGISAAKVCRVLEDFIVDWHFDRLNGSREAFSHPEEVLQTVVDLANDPHVGSMLYDGRYGSGPRSLNFNFYQMIFLLTVRADGWTGMEDPDNQIAEIAEHYLGRIQKTFSAQEWKSRYD